LNFQSIAIKLNRKRNVAHKRCKATKYCHWCITYPKCNAYCTLPALTISYFSIYVCNFSATRTQLSRKEILPWNKFRGVLFERVPSIINLPGELFRAIDVESADVLVPHDAEDMSCCFFACTLWKMEVFVAIVTVCTDKRFYFDVSRLFSHAKCVLHPAIEFYVCTTTYN